MNKKQPTNHKIPGNEILSGTIYMYTWSRYSNIAIMLSDKSLFNILHRPLDGYIIMKYYYSFHTARFVNLSWFMLQIYSLVSFIENYICIRQGCYEQIYYNICRVKIWSHRLEEFDVNLSSIWWLATRARYYLISGFLTSIY